MAITLSDACKNAACDAVVDKCDVGGAGTLEIQTSADAVLATFTLANPAFGAAGAVTAGLATAAAIANVTATGTGTATKFVVKNNGGTELWNGTVTLTGAGGDMTLDNTSIVTGQTVSITSLTHSQP